MFVQGMRFVLVVVLGVLVGPLSAAGILWQGKVLTAEGVPPTRRTQTLEFRLYTSEQDGRPLWGRAVTVQLSPQGMAVATLSDDEGSPLDGLYRAGFEELLATRRNTLWLGLAIQGNGEFSPRQPLGEGSRALHAKYASGAAPGKPFAVTGRLMTSSANLNELKVAKDVMVSDVMVVNGGLTVNGGVTVSDSKGITGYGVAPVGAIVAVWSKQNGVRPTMPSGWLLCDGTNGTPNLQGKFIVGAGSSYKVGDTGGSDAVKLSLDQIPSHDHSFKTHGARAENRDGVPDEGTDTINDYRSYWRKGAYDRDVATFSTGSNTLHSNLPPYQALYWFIRVK